MSEQIEIIAFYEFKDMLALGELAPLRESLKELMRSLRVHGTIILAGEGYNGMICGDHDSVMRFVTGAGKLLVTTLKTKSSFHHAAPFRRVDVKIKSEIVTLKQDVDISLGEGTYVSPRQWNELISDPDVVVLDTRNDYEYKTGTFIGAVNPETCKFSELPNFVAENLDPAKTPKVAMFCTGGIRCEKFAPYLKQLGFENVYQLEGGILKYLEEVDSDHSLWQGECFVFDERVTVDHRLNKGEQRDLSLRQDKRKKPLYKIS